MDTGLSKRKLIKNIKELYTKKGTVDGHKLFFRMLFDEEIEVIFPRDNLLGSSDGSWNTEPIVRVTISGNVNFSNGRKPNSYWFVFWCSLVESLSLQTFKKVVNLLFNYL